MLKVGITGGIGSGKTTACSIFSTFGVPVYYADLRGREITNTDPQVISQVIELFGEESYTEGILNSKWIAGKVFRDTSLLHQMNAIIHPAVLKDSMEWFASHYDKPYVLYEAAIMFETGSYVLMDKMITVVAPVDDRIERIILRDKVTREEVLDRIAKQLPDDEKISKSHFVIYNDQTSSLIEQVTSIHKQLLVLAAG